MGNAPARAAGESPAGARGRTRPRDLPTRLVHPQSPPGTRGHSLGGAGSRSCTHGLRAAAEHPPQHLPIPRSKLDIGKNGTGKRWHQCGVAQLREGSRREEDCASAAYMHGPPPDECGIAGAWPHLVALPETSLEGSLQASLSSPGAWPWGRRPSRGQVHLPQPGNAAKGCPRRELQARRESAGQEGARRRLWGALERHLRGPGCP